MSVKIKKKTSGGNVEIGAERKHEEKWRRRTHEKLSRHFANIARRDGGQHFKNLSRHVRCDQLKDEKKITNEMEKKNIDMEEEQRLLCFV